MNNQIITRIRIYARGSQASPGPNIQTVNFYWRISTLGSYSTAKDLTFDGTSFYWQDTSYWDNLELDEAEVNALQIKMEIGGGIQQQPGQAISVMYVVLTVKTNNPPTVSLTYPIGGETLNDSALVEWSYNDLDGDSISFNLSYRIAGGSWMPIITKENSAWRISNNRDTTGMHFAFEDGSRGWQAANSATELNMDEWYHVCGVYDINIGAKIYINGVEDGSNPDTQGITQNTDIVAIGGKVDSGNYTYWYGGLDEVYIYNRALPKKGIMYLAQ